MLSNLLASIFTYYQVSLAYFFTTKSRQYHIGYGLICNMSYRLPESSNHDYLIGFKILKRLLSSLLSRKQEIKIVDPTGIAAILDGDFRFYDLETDYLNRQSNEKIKLFIGKSLMVYSNSKLIGIFYFFMMFFFTLPFLFLTIFSKRRGNYALIITEIFEAASILNLCKKENIQKIYDFIPFEKDSNVMAHLLIKNNIQVSKLPSPGPLKTHNSILVCNDLILSSAYQFDEIKVLKNTLYYDTLKKWVPEYAFTYIDKYAKHTLEPPPNTIGFYSHGGWVRSEKGDRKDGLSIEDSEITLLEELQDFLSVNPGTKLVVFPHPKEKKIELKEKKETFYARFFQSLNYVIVEDQIKTAQAFELVDVAVASFSTIIYERLLCGFKTLVGAYDIQGFPIKESSFNNICIKKKGQLNNILKTALSQTTDQFFTQNQIQAYHFMSYPYFLKE